MVLLQLYQVVQGVVQEHALVLVLVVEEQLLQ